MEDQERGMETSERMTVQPKKKRKKSKGLTIMVIRRVGKVRSFELAGRTVLWVVIFLILYIPVSIFFTNGFFQLRRESAQKSLELKRYEEALDQADKDLFESKRHYESLLYDSANNPQKRKSTVTATAEKVPPEDKKQKSAPPAKKVAAKKPDVTKKPEPKPTTAAPAASPTTSPANNPYVQPKEVVDVQELTVHREGSYIDVNFKLVNLQPRADQSLGGYVHIIAETWDTFPPQVWTSPKEGLKNGYPLNFRKGELFIIKRFKPITRRIDLLPSSDEPAIIRVLIYNQAGELKFEKEFEVNDAP